MKKKLLVTTWHLSPSVREIEIDIEEIDSEIINMNHSELLEEYFDDLLYDVEPYIYVDMFDYNKTDDDEWPDEPELVKLHVKHNENSKYVASVYQIDDDIILNEVYAYELFKKLDEINEIEPTTIKNIIRNDRINKLLKED